MRARTLGSLSASLLLGCVSVLQGQVTVGPKNVNGQNLIELYSADTGILETVGVAIGDQVSRGQVIAKLDDEKHVYAWKVALLRADNQGALRAAHGEVTERNALLEEARDRLRRRQISEKYVRSLEGRMETSAGRLEQAVLSDKILDLDLEMAKNALQRRYVRSTVDGVVVAINKTERSRVAQGEVVITIADLNNLSVDVPATPELLEAMQGRKAVPVSFGPGKPPIMAQVMTVKNAADKKKGQIAQLIFPSLLPQPFADAVNVVDTDVAPAAPTPAPTAGTPPKSKS